MKKMLFLTLLMLLATNSQAKFYESDGMIVMEAENYTGVRGQVVPAGYAWVLTDNVLASGGKYMYFGDISISNYTNFNQTIADNAARLDYEVEVVTGGTYYLWGCGYDNPGNSWFVGVDGANPGNTRLTESGDWVWWGNDQGGGRAKITLTPGTHTINVWWREKSCGLDKLILTTSIDYPRPTGFGPNESPTAVRGGAHMPVPTNKNNQVNIGTVTSVSWYSPEQDTLGAAKDDPNIVSVNGYDVRFGTNPDPNSLTPVFTTLQNLPALLDPATTYYWRVDTRVTWNIAGFPSVVKGEVWQFTTLAPTLTFKNVITTLALSPAALSATVAGFKNPISSAVFELLTAGATLTNTTVDMQNPTATLTAATDGTYQVKLTVSDGTSTQEKIAEVKVYADACAAKKASPGGWTANYYDKDSNCLVELSDLMVYVSNWLNSTEMKVQETYAKTTVTVLDLDIQVEAESAYAEGDPNYQAGQLGIASDILASGGQYRNVFSTGSFQTYEVVVAETGAYTLFIRANHEWGRTAALNLVTNVTLDGNPANDTLTLLATIPMPGTGTSGNKWYQYSVSPVNLTAGTHLMRLSNADAWNIGPDVFGFKKNF